MCRDLSPLKHALFSMFLAYIYSCSFELRRIVNLTGLLVQFSPFDLITEKNVDWDLKNQIKFYNLNTDQTALKSSLIKVHSVCLDP